MQRSSAKHFLGISFGSALAAEARPLGTQNPFTMGKYGDTAVRAVEILQGSRRSAEEAWRQAAAEVFPDAPEARAKTCPREAFLGLVERGLIRDVSPDRCAPSAASKNRVYSTTAVNLLASDPKLAEASKADLWRRVMRKVGADIGKKHNQQLDVVLTLRERRLLGQA